MKNEDLSEEYESEEFDPEDDYSEKTTDFSDNIDVVEDYIENEYEENADEVNEEDLIQPRKIPRDKNRYQKYKNISCPHCRRTFHADKIRYTHIRSAIIYSCPLCKTLLSINNKQQRWRGSSNNSSHSV